MGVTIWESDRNISVIFFCNLTWWTSRKSSSTTPNGIQTDDVQDKKKRPTSIFPRLERRKLHCKVVRNILEWLSFAENSKIQSQTSFWLSFAEHSITNFDIRMLCWWSKRNTCTFTNMTRISIPVIRILPYAKCRIFFPVVRILYTDKVITSLMPPRTSWS